MAHANLSKPALELYKQTKAKYKFCDSGAFSSGVTKKKTDIELLDTYERYGVTDGVMMDVLNNSLLTVANAKKILSLYNKGNYSFSLWAVAQGTTVKEYIKCYHSLKALGFDHVAIGGMVKTKEDSPYPAVDEKLLFGVLSCLPSNDTSFALGALNHRRYYKLSTMPVLGADSGQWRFKYDNNNKDGDVLTRRARKFAERKNWIDTHIISKISTQQSSLDSWFD